MHRLGDFHSEIIATTEDIFCSFWAHYYCLFVPSLSCCHKKAMVGWCYILDESAL